MICLTAMDEQGVPKVPIVLRISTSNDVLQDRLPDIGQRRTCEQKLIAKFNSKNNGLNRDLGFLSNY